MPNQIRWLKKKNKQLLWKTIDKKSSNLIKWLKEKNQYFFMKNILTKQANTFIKNKKYINRIDWYLCVKKKDSEY